MRHDRCLDRYKEAFFLPGVLQDDGKSVVDRTVHATVGAEKAGHRRRAPKQVEGLVECVGACMIDGETLSPRLLENTNASASPTEPKCHALARNILLVCPAGNPAWIGVVEVDVCLEHIAESAVADEVVQSAEIAVESPVYRV